MSTKNVDIFGNNDNQAEGATAEEVKKYEFFANIVVPVQYKGRTINLTLPSNKILDDMRLRDEKDGELASMQNAFYQQLMTAAAGMEPGARMEVPNLKVELYRAPVDGPAEGPTTKPSEINLGF